MWTALDDKSSARYLHYIIREVTNHITEMQKLVDAPTQANLVKLDGFLDYYNLLWTTRGLRVMYRALKAIYALLTGFYATIYVRTRSKGILLKLNTDERIYR